jgi:Thiol-disulfide isomerase and thioredoxins
MKAIIKNLALVAVFAVVFSSLTGCGGSSGANTAGGGANNKPGSKGADYPPLVGALTNADLTLIDGTVTKVADRKGKVLLLNLWATWCGPCRSEMPHLVEMQDQYRDQDFQILGLNVGNEGGPESVEDIKKFAEMMKLNYELARIPDETTIQFYKATNFQAIPISMVVDREGRLRGVFLGGGGNVIKQIERGGREGRCGRGHGRHGEPNGPARVEQFRRPEDGAKTRERRRTRRVGRERTREKITRTHV